MLLVFVEERFCGVFYGFLGICGGKSNSSLLVCVVLSLATRPTWRLSLTCSSYSKSKTGFGCSETLLIEFGKGVVLQSSRS